MRARLTAFIVIFQAILFAGHWFLYETLIRFLSPVDPFWTLKLQVALALLSVTFVPASLLAFRYSHLLVRVFYTISAVWLGILSFCFFAACSCWILYSFTRLFGIPVDRRALAVVLFGFAILASSYGIINASRVRVKRITVKLPNLPESWRRRIAALVTDTHLGHVRNSGFLRLIVTVLSRLQPDVVFISGDLYDGTAVDLNPLTELWARFSAPLGTFFVTGNHEEFSSDTKYIRSIEQSRVRVLNNEMVTLDGMQIVGVRHHDSVDALRLKSILQAAGLDRGRASILLTHGPYHLPIVEQEGISLQLCGHTHGGQFFPFTWITSRVYRKFVYGLNRVGKLLVYTSSGAGTWGPPMRVGTKPEIVLIQFE
ncbi:MAG: metallophosphoesterase [Terriglobia bacterium]